MQLRRDGETWPQVVVTLVAFGATACALLALVLHQFATPWQYTIVLAALSHYLMWTAPVALGCALLAQRRFVAIGAGLCCVAVFAVQLPPQIGPLFRPSAGREMPVLQANLGIGRADPDALVDLVRSRHVQVLATEELTGAAQRRLIAAGLPALLPYRFTAPLPDGGGGLGIWSSLPLRAEHNLPGYQLGVLTAHAGSPGRGFTVVAVHLLPPYPYPPGTWRAEIARLHTLLAGLPPGPVIVPGDFNATVDHAQFRALLDHGIGDAADDSGSGYLPTYPADRWYPPLIGIDHVLYRGLRPDSVDTYDLPGSDHRALLARFAG